MESKKFIWKSLENKNFYDALVIDGFLFSVIEKQINSKYYFIIGIDKYDYTYEHNWDRFTVLSFSYNKILELYIHLFDETELNKRLVFGAETLMFDILTKVPKLKPNRLNPAYSRLQLLQRIFNKVPSFRLDQIRDVLSKHVQLSKSNTCE